MDVSFMSAIDYQSILSTVFFSGLALWLLVRKPLGIPPGPRWRTPILGNLREFASHFGLKSTLKGLRASYGDIYSLFLGRRLVIVVSGKEAIDRMLRKDEKILEKKDVFGELATILGSQSKLSKECSDFAMSLEMTLTNPLNIQDKTYKAVEYLTAEVNKAPDKTFDPVGLISLSAINLVSTILWDEKFEDERKMKLLSSLNEDLSSLRGQEILMKLVPAAKYLPSERVRCKKLDDTRRRIHDLLQREIEESKSVWEWKEDDFLSTYFNMIKGVGEPMKDSNLCELLVTVYIKLTRSLTTMIYSSVWFLMLNTDIQERLRTDLLNLTGSKREQHNATGGAKCLNMIEAFVLETKRFVKMNGLLGYPRQTTSESRLLGYGVPSSTLLLADIESLMTDPTIWKNSSGFEPARFLTDNGELSKTTPGLGYMRGDDVAWLDAFIDKTTVIFVTSLLQSFKIALPDGTQPGRYDRRSRYAARFESRY